jgi:hypothetical protein
MALFIQVYKFANIGLTSLLSTKFINCSNQGLSMSSGQKNCRYFETTLPRNWIYNLLPWGYPYWASNGSATISDALAMCWFYIPIMVSKALILSQTKIWRHIVWSAIITVTKPSLRFYNPCVRQVAFYKQSKKQIRRKWGDAKGNDSKSRDLIILLREKAIPGQRVEKTIEQQVWLGNLLGANVSRSWPVRQAHSLRSFQDFDACCAPKPRYI